MPRIVFFVENNWVFGKIFNELIKHLFPVYDGDIMDWSRYLSPEERLYLNAKYDLFFSTPVGCFFLHDQYGTPLERCYGHAHSEFDIDDALRRFPREYFDRLGGYGAVSAAIVQKSVRAQVSRIPTLLPVGVTAKNYRRNPARTGVTTLGYLGRKARHDAPTDTTAADIDIKRGYLAERVAAATGVTLVQREQIAFSLVDQVYTDLDLVIFCSLTEGNPYMALEAMAAGIPVLGTEVGLFPELTLTGGGLILPTEPDALVHHATAMIMALQRDTRLYDLMRQAAAVEGARRDWAVLKPQWLAALAEIAAPG